MVFWLPVPPCQAEELAPANPTDPPLQVAESLLNQEPKPRPVMRHDEEAPASAVSPARPPRAGGKTLRAAPASAVKSGKKKKRKAKAVSQDAAKAKPSVKAVVRAKTKAASAPVAQTKKAATKTPGKPGKRKSKKDKSR